MDERRGLHTALRNCFTLQECDRAIPSPNRLTERFSYKIKHLLKNIALLYSPGSHANELDAGP